MKKMNGAGVKMTVITGGALPAGTSIMMKSGITGAATRVRRAIMMMTGATGVGLVTVEAGGMIKAGQVALMKCMTTGPPGAVIVTIMEHPMAVMARAAAMMRNGIDAAIAVTKVIIETIGGIAAAITIEKEIMVPHQPDTANFGQPLDLMPGAGHKVISVLMSELKKMSMSV
jgi:hypothetical protein